MFGYWPPFGTLTNSAEKEKAVYLNGGIIPVHIEWTGIIDMLAEVNGGLYVVDHKTTSIISQDFFDGFEIAMQPTGYFAAMRAAFPESPPSLFPDYRTSDYAIQTFHSYITHYQNEILTPFVHEGKPLVEFSFA